MIAILHNIRSLHNIGSIFRTADAAGIEKLYLTGITSAPVDRFGKKRIQITKVSLGAETYIPWEKVESLPSLITKLHKKGYRVIALEQSRASVPYTNVKAQRKLALIMGNEVKGLSASLLKRADGIIEIPMRGEKESLNVAVAFGVVVFALQNK
jgi:23S rRNA (guanosine2251-2'-O)-methyltransferase